MMMAPLFVVDLDAAKRTQQDFGIENIGRDFRSSAVVGADICLLKTFVDIED